MKHIKLYLYILTFTGILIPLFYFGITVNFVLRVPSFKRISSHGIVR